MSDNVLSAALAFSLLVVGTAAIGSEMVRSRHVAPQQAAAVVTLPTVTIVGNRQATPETVTLDPVVITRNRLTPPVVVEALAEPATRL